MRPSTKLLAVIGSIIAFSAMVLYPQSIHGGQKTYEIHPQVAMPGYGTDTSLIIDSYERVIERYMDLTERDLFDIGENIRSVAKRLDSIDRKLNRLSKRMTEIEKALGIKQAEPATEEKPPPKASHRKVGEKYLPSRR